MADKVTGNPYEHEEMEADCGDCVIYKQGSTQDCLVSRCPVVCIPECPACIWEVAYKAGQKEAVMKVLDKLQLNEIDAYNWQDTTEKYPSLLAKTVKEIKKEWGIV
jgi:hypothetical protein